MQVVLGNRDKSETVCDLTNSESLTGYFIYFSFSFLRQLHILDPPKQEAF